VLEQRSRPQLFSNGLAPTVPASSRRALGLLAAGPDLVDRLRAKVATFRRLLEDGVFVTGFGFPVVPEGTARIRAQISAAHTEAQLTRAADALAAALA
jgi:glycine C-acetyltransferase